MPLLLFRLPAIMASSWPLAKQERYAPLSLEVAAGGRDSSRPSSIITVEIDI